MSKVDTDKEVGGVKEEIPDRDMQMNLFTWLKMDFVDKMRSFLSIIDPELVILTLMIVVILLFNFSSTGYWGKQVVIPFLMVSLLLLFIVLGSAKPIADRFDGAKANVIQQFIEMIPNIILIATLWWYSPSITLPSATVAILQLDFILFVQIFPFLYRLHPRVETTVSKCWDILVIWNQTKKPLLVKSSLTILYIGYELVQDLTKSHDGIRPFILRCSGFVFVLLYTIMINVAQVSIVKKVQSREDTINFFDDLNQWFIDFMSLAYNWWPLKQMVDDQDFLSLSSTTALGHDVKQRLVAMNDLKEIAPKSDVIQFKSWNPQVQRQQDLKEYMQRLAPWLKLWSPQLQRLQELKQCMQRIAPWYKALASTAALAASLIVLVQATNHAQYDIDWLGTSVRVLPPRSLSAVALPTLFIIFSHIFKIVKMHRDHPDIIVNFRGVFYNIALIGASSILLSLFLVYIRKETYMQLYYFMVIPAWVEAQLLFFMSKLQSCRTTYVLNYILNMTWYSISIATLTGFKVFITPFPI